MVNPPTDNPVPPSGEPDGDGPEQTPRHLSPEVLSAYLDDQLTSSERSVAAAHLATCPDCQQELAELRATVRLLQALPQYRPRRSFVLDPAQAGIARPVTGGSRLARWLPALRIATVAVAVLLVAVVAGDLIDHSGQSGSNTSSPSGGGPALQRAAGTNPTEAASHSQSAALPAATHPPAASSNQAPAAVAPVRTPEHVFEVKAPASSPAATTRATATPAPVATPGSGSRAGTEGGGHQRPSYWRIAEIALGLLLVWLLVSWIGLARLRHRGQGPE